MEKIKINLDQLKVDSFEITKSTQEKGTVKGFFTTVQTNYITCIDPPCQYTDQITCEYLCENSRGQRCEYTGNQLHKTCTPDC